MKNYQIFLPLIILLANIGYSQEKETIITGKIKGNIAEKVGFTMPIQNTCNWGFKDFVKPDSLGNFKIIISIDQPAIMKLFIPKKTGGSIFLIPGKNYKVAFNSQNDVHNFEILKGEKGQKIYNKNAFSGNVYSATKKFKSNYSVLQIQQNIVNQKEKELSIFQKALQQNKLSQAFYNFVKNERDSYYSAVLAQVLLSKFHRSTNPNNSVLFTETMKEFWKKSFEEYPVTQKQLLSSPYWYEYAKNYIEYKQYTAKDFSLEALKKAYKNGLIHTQHIIVAEKYLSRIFLENYKAAYIGKQSSQKRFKKELITLFTTFKKEFPKSEYIPYLDAMIQPIITFHKKASVPLNKNIQFVKKTENINSLKELTNLFKGKRIYIDVWATWCGPCKEEFKYKKGLKDLLNSKGVELLYISIDREEKEKHWREMIKFYDLEGQHIRVNKILQKELITIFDSNGSIMIPWYLLIGKHGKILKKHAKKPSQLKELEREINTLKKE